MYPSREQLEAYIRQSAASQGIDPDIALKVARSEGLNANPAEAWRSTARNKTGLREPSYTPFQLLVGGPGTGYPTGMGNDFIAQTGLDPSNPANVYKGIDFALSRAKTGGWSPWYGAKNVGISRWQGINAQAAGQQAAQAAAQNMAATKGIAGLTTAAPAVNTAASQLIPFQPQVAGATAPATGGLGGLIQMAMMASQPAPQPAVPTPAPMQKAPQQQYGIAQLYGRRGRDDKEEEKRREARRAY